MNKKLTTLAAELLHYFDIGPETVTVQDWTGGAVVLPDDLADILIEMEEELMKGEDLEEDILYENNADEFPEFDS